MKLVCKNIGTNTEHWHVEANSYTLGTGETNQGTYGNGGISNWEDNWEKVGARLSEASDEIETLVTTKTYALCTDPEKDIAAKWRIVSATDIANAPNYSPAWDKTNAEWLAKANYQERMDKEIEADAAALVASTTVASMKARKNSKHSQFGVVLLDGGHLCQESEETGTLKKVKVHDDNSVDNETP